MKNKTLTLVAIITLLLMVVGATYAFFAPQAGGTTSSNATVTSNTTDLLTFSINRDISFTVTQAMFTENGTNQSGDATATATLTPNNKTGAATMNYYLYLNIESNPTVYSAANTNEDPELMLQVFDGNNQLVTLTGLGTQKTIKGVTGYDITGVEGLQTLLNNHAISASNNTATIENWRVVITLINLDVNQNDNTGKEISAEIIIRRDDLDLTFNGNGTIYRTDSNIVSIGDSVLAANNDPGLTDYETDFNVIKNRGYLIGYDNEYTNYDTYSQCLSQIGIDQYCMEYAVIAPIYLKHDVIDNAVENTEVCMHFYNNVVCIGPDDWVENDSTGSLTASKIENDYASLFEDYYFGELECNVNNYRVTCNFSTQDYYEGKIEIYSNGRVSISLYDDIYSCILLSDGQSRCFLPEEAVNLSTKYLIFDGAYYLIDSNVADSFYRNSLLSVPDSYENNSSSYIGFNTQERTFIMIRPNYGFDACFYLNNIMYCGSELIEDTPLSNNYNLTASMIKTKLENSFGYEVHTDVNAITPESNFPMDHHISIIVPFEELTNSSENSFEVNIYFSGNDPYISIDLQRIAPDWSLVNFGYSCGYLEIEKGLDVYTCVFD